MMRDEFHNTILAPKTTGRIAFWQGRPIFGNPFTGDHAVAWREGWQAAAQDYTTRGGQPDGRDLGRLRPDDIPEAGRGVRRTQRGAGKAWIKAMKGEATA